MNIPEEGMATCAEKGMNMPKEGMATYVEVVCPW